MPKAVRISQSPSCPGSSEAASTQPRAVATASSGPTPFPRFTSFDSWPATLDDDLVKFLSATPNREADAIVAIHAAHPEIAEDLIWARILYLGLTRRKRRPYKTHHWTEVEDEILKQEYGRSKAASQAAIEKILALHPNWSRDAIVWRARVLGLTQHRPIPREEWSPTLDYHLLSLMECQLETIARRLQRSEKAVLARLRRLGWNADFFGGFKTKDLVVDLRVSEATVNLWVRRGWLQRKKGRITEESLRWLCRYHPEEIPLEVLTPVVQNWLTKALDYGRGDLSRRGGRKKAS
ncbi:MAG TPA: hypothetical protein VG897_19710 [Terriglobales bacterium]|nr:hypothetical protein [Terriglobales bacterium]